MMKPLKTAAVFGLGVVVAALGIAGAKEVLQPQLTPEKGSFDKPEGKIGESPDKPWSVTTVAAAVDGKPLAGKVTTVTGEIIDYSCYLQLGKHGGKHRDCGQKCLKAGMPIGILTKDGTLYLQIGRAHV